MTGVVLVLVLAGVLVLMGAVAAVTLVVVVRSRRRDRLSDAVFARAPITRGTVIERTFGHRRVANASKYRIVYRVDTPAGPPFTGWEDAYLMPQQARQFAVGTIHPVAHLPGRTSEVRGLAGPPPTFPTDGPPGPWAEPPGYRSAG